MCIVVKGARRCGSGVGGRGYRATAGRRTWQGGCIMHGVRYSFDHRRPFPFYANLHNLFGLSWKKREPFLFRSLTMAAVEPDP